MASTRFPFNSFGKEASSVSPVFTFGQCTVLVLVYSLESVVILISRFFASITNSPNSQVMINQRKMESPKRESFNEHNSVMEKRNSVASASMHRRHVQVPAELKGLVIGKAGSNLRKYQNTPGISSVKLLPDGTLVIAGFSKEAVVSIQKSVNARICYSNATICDFQVFCFCCSLEKPQLRTQKLGFETMFQKNGCVFVCLTDAEAQQVDCSTHSESSASSSLAVQMAQKLQTAHVTFVPHWDFSGYKQTLVSCFQNLEPADSQVKLIVRFGKQMFSGSGPCCSQLLANGCSSVEDLGHLWRQKQLWSRFNLGCCQEAVDALRSRLQTELGFVMVCQQRKISIHALHRSQHFNVSVRFVDAQGKQIGGYGVKQEEEALRILRAKDYLEVLGVKKGASKEEIKEGYRRCLLRLQFRVSDWKLIQKAEDVVDAAYLSLLRGRGDGFSRCTGGVVSRLSSESESGEARMTHNVKVSRVREKVARNGFVTFMRPGGSITDFRLGVSSHHDDDDGEHPLHHFSKWVESAWSNRTSDNKLVFPVSNALNNSSNGLRNAERDLDPEAFNVRYKQTETYVTEDFKIRIRCVEEQNLYGENNKEEIRWECALSSRWFKWEESMRYSTNPLLEKEVVRLLTQAAVISKAMQFKNATARAN